MAFEVPPVSQCSRNPECSGCRCLMSDGLGLSWLRLMPTTVRITPTPEAAWVTEIKCIYAHCCATSAFWNNRDSESLLSHKREFFLPVCVQLWQMCERVGPVGPESDMGGGRQGLLWWDVMMARCQLCEMVQGAVRTAAGVLSHWSPREEGGMKGEESGREIAWRGDALRGSVMLAGCPPQMKKQLETYIACAKTPQGETQMDAWSVVFSSGRVIISPSMTCTVWSLRVIGYLYF